MKNNKGFTMIELIAVVAILGLLMMLAVPNINSMIDKRKRESYLTDAKKLVSLAEYKFNTSSSIKPAKGSYCKVYKFSDLDTTDIDNPPNDGKYDPNLSYVYIKYDVQDKSDLEKVYTYYVQLVEKYNVGSEVRYRGVKETDSKNLDFENSKMKYVSTTMKDEAYFNHTISCTSV